MDGLSLFGLFAVTAMLVCYTLEHRSPWFILAFAAACGLSSIYGFLQGLAVRHRRGGLGAYGCATVAHGSRVTAPGRPPVAYHRPFP